MSATVGGRRIRQLDIDQPFTTTAILQSLCPESKSNATHGLDHRPKIPEFPANLHHLEINGTLGHDVIWFVNGLDNLLRVKTSPALLAMKYNNRN
jgi:hypothetical protein